VIIEAWEETENEGLEVEGVNEKHYAADAIVPSHLGLKNKGDRLAMTVLRTWW
jgi:hypothetical protein